jgi:hypothetical protein
VDACPRLGDAGELAPVLLQVNSRLGSIFNGVAPVFHFCKHMLFQLLYPSRIGIVKTIPLGRKAQFQAAGSIKKYLTGW